MARKKKGEVYKELEPDRMIRVLLKTVHHFFGPARRLPGVVKDPRNKKMSDYPLAHLFWTGILLFLTKRGARRLINYDFRTQAFAHNLDLLAGSELKEVADHGTLNYLLSRVDPKKTMRIGVRMIRCLLRSKCLAWGRLLGHYLVAVDGTGHLVFRSVTVSTV